MENKKGTCMSKEHLKSHDKKPYNLNAMIDKDNFFLCIKSSLPNHLLLEVKDLIPITAIGAQSQLIKL